MQLVGANNYNKSGEHAQPEREGLDDDVLRTQGRQLEGKKILGYFCQNKDWKKIWPEGKPRKSKAFCWDEQNGFLVDYLASLWSQAIFLVS